MYCNMIRRVMGKIEAPFCLFCDQAPVHKAIVVRNLCAELQITLMLNIPYSPQFNCIELCFAVVKQYFKSQRLNQLAND